MSEADTVTPTGTGDDSQPRPLARAGEGLLLIVVGPSGAGKDSLINAARRSYRADSRLVFARRIVTRMADRYEDHDTVDAQTFERMAQDGTFLITWQANGLEYGLPASLRDALAAGSIVIANVSRAVVPQLRQRFARTLIVHVTAAPHVLARRLAGRGRETPAAQGERLIRARAAEKGLVADITIDNSGALEEATARFNTVIAALLRGQKA
ncbi:MAG: phosphonate metabolism protein/1,5-bisphosphokinase (PRPP-forming) PhnN [Bosea sp. (in: a-proteobacteria)]